MAARLTLNIEPYLEQLRAFPFVRAVAVRAARGNADQSEDVRLSLRTPNGRQEVAVEVKTVPLSRSAAESLAARVPRGQSWVVFSPYVSQPVGELLVSQGVGFLDQAGNCHIALGCDYLAHVEGRRPTPPARRGRGLGARSYQVLFALLAQPALAAVSVRSLAEAANVQKTTAAELLLRLKEEGLLLRDKRGWRIAQPKVLMDRWLDGYADKLRPRLLVGRYRAAENDPLAFEKQVEKLLGDRLDWAWGGAAAGFRLTRHYRGDTTTLHLAAHPASVQRQLGLLPSNDGTITILGVPGPLGLAGPAPHIAHPLLVYTELLMEGEDRARESAEEIRSRHLEPTE